MATTTGVFGNGRPRRAARGQEDRTLARRGERRKRDCPQRIAGRISRPLRARGRGGRHVDRRRNDVARRKIERAGRVGGTHLDGGEQRGGTGAGAGTFGAGGGVGGGGNQGAAILPGVRITADAVNNTLLIYANQESYRLIEQTLRQVDRPQLQVGIDATIAEITLNENLNYGVQAYLSSANVGAGADKGSALDHRPARPC